MFTHTLLLPLLLLLLSGALPQMIPLSDAIRPLPSTPTPSPLPSSPSYINPYYAALSLDRLIQCDYDEDKGVWRREGLWQTANTLETTANLIHLFRLLEENPQPSHLGSPSFKQNISTYFLNILRNSFGKTGPFMDHCYDDYQWWLLAWVRAYSVDPNIAYLQRAATIFDRITTVWSADECGGGVIWCPTNHYKNAITNELFLTSAMRLHPYASLLARDKDFYISWARKEWAWFEESGMINGDKLINDGLTNTCTNNGQNTWTYNQGVLLDGLALLGTANSNTTLINIANSLLQASMKRLSDSQGILTEKCVAGGCGTDGNLFKGIYMRHVRYYADILTGTADSKHVRVDRHGSPLSTSPKSPFSSNNITGLSTHLSNISEDISAFQAANAESILAHDTCATEYHDVAWQGPCVSPDAATMSAATDALWAAASVNVVKPGAWVRGCVGAWVRGCVNDFL